MFEDKCMKNKTIVKSEIIVIIELNTERLHVEYII